MQKDNLYTPTWFKQTIFYPKKCVNYDKSNSQQNSIKGQKETNSGKNAKKKK